MANTFKVLLTLNSPASDRANPQGGPPIQFKFDLAILGGGTLTWNGDVPVPIPGPHGPWSIGFMAGNLESQQADVSATQEGKAIFSESVDPSKAFIVIRELEVVGGLVLIEIKSEPGVLDI